MFTRDHNHTFAHFFCSKMGGKGEGGKEGKGGRGRGGCGFVEFVFSLKFYNNPKNKNEGSNEGSSQNRTNTLEIELRAFAVPNLEEYWDCRFFFLRRGGVCGEGGMKEVKEFFFILFRKRC